MGSDLEKLRRVALGLVGWWSRSDLEDAAKSAGLTNYREARNAIQTLRSKGLIVDFAKDGSRFQGQKYMARNGAVDTCKKCGA